MSEDRSAWSRLPLRTQLTAVFTGLLVVGLLLSGGVALTLLERTLISQIDSQLSTAAQPVVDQALHSGIRGNEEAVERGFSDYHVTFLDAEGGTLDTWSINDDGGAPVIPALTTDQVIALDGKAFTVDDTTGDGHWRVLVKPASGSAIVGAVAVALPLDSAEATLREMKLFLGGIALGVVVVGAFAGWWAVRRSLRPLRRIEDTAAAIAEGDLSRRVPPEPPTTEVGRLSAALNTMLSQIEQAFDARAASEDRMRRFVADASHELRTPLATIRGYGELYRIGALPPDEHAAAMRRIEDSAHRMGALVEDLLHLARLDENRPMHRDHVDLAVLAADAVADLRALDSARPVRLEPLAEGGTTAGALAWGDEARLRQVVANLIGNVVQHTPGGTPTELAVGRTDGAAILEVRDHGPGIPPEHAARVFERFYRIDAARGRESGGAGLGMAIVAAIVEAHGGRVELAATPGGGTTVRVILAAIEEDADADDLDDLEELEVELDDAPRTAAESADTAEPGDAADGPADRSGDIDDDDSRIEQGHRMG
ncbi:HAMP domain-containing histidine kinase [Actinotalea sp. M2MS4P-6]|uniref:sensor histidine kinase n=1 Tax=Actinotalea sp. M2MS4P-6 TaxID=2983762 RepID=UPI0021E369AA|nr:HAMP domain-containing sensor histidine kinase [Actinotalea sp. M2MS4P-6]MCV2395077.1 HAMP domain-containing histidine kinase [Actinotalea sp. M2MS4P-6]